MHLRLSERINRKNSKSFIWIHDAIDKLQLDCDEIQYAISGSEKNYSGDFIEGKIKFINNDIKLLMYQYLFLGLPKDSKKNIPEEQIGLYENKSFQDTLKKDIKDIVDGVIKYGKNTVNLTSNKNYFFGRIDLQDTLIDFNIDEVKLEQLYGSILKDIRLYHMIEKFSVIDKEIDRASKERSILLNELEKNLKKEFNSGITNTSIGKKSTISLNDNLFNLISFDVKQDKISNLKVSHKPIFTDSTYIESPIIMYFDRMDMAEKTGVPFHIEDLLNKLSTENNINEDNYINLKQQIGDILQGKIEYNKDSNQYMYLLDRYIDTPLKMTNTATGIKSLGILQLLNTHNWINNNSILIIDEPEVHLHPKWQLEYCKVVCDLVSLGVNVLITTHSPYIVQALNKYSKDTINMPEVKYYLAESSEEGSKIVDTTEKITAIFEKLTAPLRDIT